MSSQPPSIVSQSLHEIASVARSISSLSRSVTLDISFPPASLPAGEIEVYLPSPPPIEDSLFSLPLEHSLVKRLTSAYRKYAFELKAVSEANLHRSIHACRQINSRFGLPSYNQRALFTAATDVYMGSLHKMIDDIMDACLSDPRHSRKWMPPLRKALSTGMKQSVFHSRAQNSVANKLQGSHCSPSKVQPLQSGFANACFSMALNSSGISSRGGSDLEDSTARRHPDVPVYKDSLLSDQNEDGRLITTYPARCVRPQSSRAGSLSFPSSSRIFFGSRATGKVREATPVVTTESVHATFLDALRGLRIRDPCQEIENTHSSPARSTTSITDVQGLPLSPSFTEPTTPSTHPPICDAMEKGSFTTMTRRALTAPTSTPSRNRVLPMSNHTSQSRLLGKPSAHANHVSLQRTTPLPQPVPSSPSSSPPLGIETTTISRAPSSAVRRRKVAPLPRRQPLADAPAFLSTSISGSGPMSLDAMPTVAARRSNPVISRTPSLASISSSQSPSDDGLDTPPSSPTIRLFDAVPPHAKLNFTSDPSRSLRFDEFSPKSESS